MKQNLNLLYAVTIGFATGVFIETIFGANFRFLFLLAVVALVCALVGRFFYTPHPRNLFTVSVFLVFVVFGVWRMEYSSNRLSEHGLHEHNYQIIELSGYVVREPEIRPRSLHVHIEAEGTRVLLILDRHTEVGYGDIVTASGRLQTPEPFEAELGRFFPYDGYLAARGVTHIIFYPDVVVEDASYGNSVVTFLLNNKESFMMRIERLIPEPQVGLAEGLLLGIKRAMSDETLADFRTTGIVHIVVLSGFNVMLVVSFVQFIFGYFLPLRPRIIASFIAIVAFAITVGMTATVTRASIMASLLLLAQYLGRSYEALRGLFIAGAFMILINPHLLVYDIGFQLSFVATWGLILVAPHLEVMFATSPLTVKGRSYVVATLATQIAVTPLLLYHVGELSVISPIVNLLILPVVAGAMLGTFITGTVSIFSETLAYPFALTSYYLLSYILIIAQWFAKMPGAAFWVPAFSFLWVPIGYLFLWWLYRRFKYWQQVKKLISPELKLIFHESIDDWHIVTMEKWLSGNKLSKNKKQ